MHLVLTEVNVFYPWPLGVGDVLAEGLQNLLLHLAERVRVHGPDAQGVHPAALEGDVEVLQAEAELGVTCPVLWLPRMRGGACRALVCSGPHAAGNQAEQMRSSRLYC